MLRADIMAGLPRAVKAVLTNAVQRAAVAMVANILPTALLTKVTVAERLGAVRLRSGIGKGLPGSLTQEVVSSGLDLTAADDHYGGQEAIGVVSVTLHDPARHAPCFTR